METASIALSDLEPRSPPLSTYSGSTTHLSRYGSSGTPSIPGSGSAQCLANLHTQEIARFNVRGWDWDHGPLDTRPTPRQALRPLIAPALDQERISSQFLRPIPSSVPVRLPALESEENENEDDEDEQSEADSIWFLANNEDAEPVVATSHSLIDLAANNAEAMDDFTEIADIVASLQGTVEDQVVELQRASLEAP